MSECQHCSLTPEEHAESAEANMVDFALMQLIASRQPEFKETIEKIVLGWRGHALPECDPLAIS